MLWLTGLALGCGQSGDGQGSAAGADGSESIAETPNPDDGAAGAHDPADTAAGESGAADAAGGSAGSPAGEPGETAGAGGAAGADGSGEGEPEQGGSEPDPSGEGGEDATGSGVRVAGRPLLVDGQAFRIQGVCWNPVGRGGVHPADLDFAGFAASDAALMRAAGINAVRTYETITDTAVLDALHAAGIRVLNMIYTWGGDEPSVVDARVEAVKDHPAILMWVLGNEWNYNGLYVGLSHQESIDAINEAAARIRAIDDTHPIASIYGEIPSQETVEAMPEIDVWGINAYRGLSFGNLFEQFEAVSDKPMFLGEYGADAYDANQGAVNLEAQADATRALTEEILDHSAAGRCLGGTIFEWADEWWKDGAGSPDAQDVGGIAPGGGPHPDQTFNEEWWGVVDIDRNPRPAYEALQSLYAAP